MAAPNGPEGREHALQRRRQDAARRTPHAALRTWHADGLPGHLAPRCLYVSALTTQPLLVEPVCLVEAPRLPDR